MRKLYLHIGTHKTGTTSLQHLLFDASSLLQINGAIVVPTSLSDKIAAACIREDCEIPPFRVDSTPSLRKDELYTECAAELAVIFSAEDCAKFILSSEHLSYFRNQSEIARLRGLFPNDISVDILLTLRDKNQFLRSYKMQLLRTGYTVSNKKSSLYYCGKDTWLVDYDSLVATYRAQFGNVVIFHYRRNYIVGDLLKHMGVENVCDERSYAFNSTASVMSVKLYLQALLVGTPLHGPAKTLLRIIRKHKPLNAIAHGLALRLNRCFFSS